MVQMYEPLYGKLAEAAIRPATVFIHGGGWLNKEHGILNCYSIIYNVLLYSI